MSAIAVVQVSNPGPSLRSAFAPESPATHESTLIAIQRLRYKVYCLERGFVAMDDCPDALEADQFDAHATHFAGEDRAGQVVATVRLVRHSSLGFPLERHADRLFPQFHRMPPARTAEISRLIVDKHHRRDTLRDPRLLLGLLLQVCEESLRAGVECLLAAMEHSLWRLLQQHGIVWTPVGGPMDYFGAVVPYWSSLERLRMSYDRLAAELSASPAPFRYLRVPPPAQRDPRARPLPFCGASSDRGRATETRTAGLRLSRAGGTHSETRRIALVQARVSGCESGRGDSDEASKVSTTASTEQEVRIARRRRARDRKRRQRSGRLHEAPPLR